MASLKAESCVWEGSSPFGDSKTSKKQANHKITGDYLLRQRIQIGGIQIIKNRMLYLFIGQANILFVGQALL